jgi:hypothetical protein
LPFLPAIDLELPREVGTDGAERPSGFDERFQVGDGAALPGACGVDFVLLQERDLAHGIANGTHDLVARISDYGLELVIGERA